MLTTSLLTMALLTSIYSEARVVVEATPQQQMTYGMDFERLWYWGGVKDKDKLARLAVKECKVDYVRVAINGAAELEEGVIKWDAYRKILDCMSALKRANPRIKFFASPRPIHEAVKDAPYTCFPLWISVVDPETKKLHLEWEKAADYLVSYVRFMKSRGFKIDYIDTKNECDRFIRPVETAKMVRRMREQLMEDMPIVIAPSSYDYKNGLAWLQEAIAAGETEFFKIAASHNTKERGSAKEFAELGRRLGKSVWNTEVHGWVGPDDVAAMNQRVLFELIRNGFSGLNDWLSLGNKKKPHKMFRNVDKEVVAMRIYYIYKKLVNTSGGGHYLRTDVPDGLTSTVAFIKGKTMTVWLLNSNETPCNVTVKLGGHSISGNSVESAWWGPDNPREGSEDKMEVMTAKSFEAVIAPRTLYCFELPIAQAKDASARQPVTD